jgi:hypothetical protein
VQHQAGHYDVELGVLEGQLPRVSVPQVDAVGDALDPRVLKRGLRPIAGFVLRAPDVHTDSPAVGQPLRRADEQQATAN